jgi:hypothetical protein
MIKGIERAIPMLRFQLRGVEIRLHGIRQDSPPNMISIDYEITVDTDEIDHRLELLHTNCASSARSRIPSLRPRDLKAGSSGQRQPRPELDQERQNHVRRDQRAQRRGSARNP